MLRHSRRWFLSLLLSWSSFRLGRAATCDEQYRVVAGDSCHGIADNLVIPFSQLKALNENPHCKTLQPGQLLCVWGDAYQCHNIYIVGQGDYCDAIASAAGLTLAQLQAYNPDVSCDSLSVGSVFCLSDPYNPPLQQPSDPNCSRYYTVASGDSCHGIADKLHMPFSQLKALNENPHCLNLQPGQQLCVTGSAYECAWSYRYTVQLGDSCSQIAADHSISLANLELYNPDTSCSSLSVGSVICVGNPYGQPTPIEPPETMPENCKESYTVKTGDYCYQIATDHGLSVDELQALNPTLDCALLAIGAQVCVVPSVKPPSSTDCITYDTVKLGDSCNAIAQRNQITDFYLLKLNPDVGQDCAELTAGEGICVDSSLNVCGSTTAVAEGEGCYDIAGRTNITLEAFLDLNPGVSSDCGNLQPEEVVCVAARLSYPSLYNYTCSRTYTVQPGDTCNKIAAKLGLASAQLAGLNPHVSCSNLIAGDPLCAYSPQTNVCPQLRYVVSDDSCYNLATNASMSLVQWQSINTYNGIGVDCTILPVNDIVCMAPGNATLPEQPTGQNEVRLPLCSTCNFNSHCCSQYSMCAPLASSLCSRDGGCQANCQEDPGVIIPQNPDAFPSNDLPTNFTGGSFANTTVPRCASYECLYRSTETDAGSCMNQTTYWCQSGTEGCVSNCLDPSQHSTVNLVHYFPVPTFAPPSGNFDQWDGNPCQDSCGASQSCTFELRCVDLDPDTDECYTSFGCLYNCYDVHWYTEDEQYEAQLNGTSLPPSITTKILVPSSTLYTATASPTLLKRRKESRRL
ncbi:uncharacterized protein PFL1_06228 [Pseudozyma flocculosa PF-1]|uniref:LysM domain-containing protein n=2 Tax=Pseudozyma flocculosa TaxID=84751 RepID=A0A5C3F713_9BASI|nr:uncharacterized protein PFL1_06228 [Pseudozyma flocculosa PF-1]EPQ26293.1 hypothetical protein PFL1_06228 [Pseudozyma flocculosa PF-1]SPO40254.1 uncharacterized protein PSFLO_05736 [Pseudozyma flocculosa]